MQEPKKDIEEKLTMIYSIMLGLIAAYLISTLIGLALRN